CRCPPPHAVIRTLCPGGQSVRLRRTTRRQRRAWHGFHLAVCRATQAVRAPGGDAVLYRPTRNGGREGLACGQDRPALRCARNVPCGTFRGRKAAKCSTWNIFQSPKEKCGAKCFG